MTLRFRNRFRGAPTKLLICPCGRRLSVSVADGRETLIHELPWCQEFDVLVGAVESDASTRFHVAVVDTALEMTIIADGAASDVRDPVKKDV